MKRNENNLCIPGTLGLDIENAHRLRPRIYKAMALQSKFFQRFTNLQAIGVSDISLLKYKYLDPDSCKY
jgi:hypothetical protein